MKRFFILFIILLSGTTLLAQEIQPKDLPVEANSVQKFIPKGWKQLHSTTGDFNKDQLEDVAVVIGNSKQWMLVVLMKEEYNVTYLRDFASSFSSIEYISKIGKRGNTLQLTFDLPSYSNGHIINVFSRINASGAFEIIGHSEETYEDNDAAAKKKVLKGLFKDVNLVTGTVEESSIVGTKRTIKKKYKEKVKKLLLLGEIDQLPVMNW